MGTLKLLEYQKNVRQNWDKAFKQMRKNNDDVLLIDDVFEDDIDV